MRVYEELFIVRPDATDEQIDPLIEQIKGVIVQAGGTLEKTDKWGTRRLAYRVMKLSEGQYILLTFNAQPEAVREIERRLRVSDLVIKFITVRIDEKMKRLEKRRKAREKRALRKPPKPEAPAAAAPLLPHEPALPVPGAPNSPAAPGAPAAAPEPETDTETAQVEATPVETPAE